MIWKDEAVGVVVVADARIHNRLDLMANLRLESTNVSDAELMARSYSRWGREFVPKLVGDFSIILCDFGRRELLLATSPNASRTLFYTADSERILVATDPEQLWSVRPFGLSNIDSETVRNYLELSYQDPQRTFFRQLHRVAPGFRTILRPQGCVEYERFFVPMAHPKPLATTREYLEEFARIFRVCVAASVDRGARHFVHLSGGLDSSSIVGALAETPPDGSTSFETITGVFPGLPSCNPTAAIASVRRRVRFRARTWDAGALSDASAETALSPWPFAVASMAVANRRDFDVAGEEGAVALISGSGGDNLAVETRVFQELVRGKRWRTLWEQIGAAGFSSRTRRFLTGVVVGQLLHVVGARVTQPAKQCPPFWAGPELRRLAPIEHLDDESLERQFPDILQREVWKGATGTNALLLFEAVQMRCVRAGVELRCPYRDQRLTEFVMSIPSQYRLPDGVMRRLQREGLTDLLPPEVRSRPKTTFGPAVRALFLKEKDEMEATLHDGRWLAAPYVDLLAVRKMLGTAEESDDFRVWIFLRRVWSLELWLRQKVV